MWAGCRIQAATNVSRCKIIHLTVAYHVKFKVPENYLQWKRSSSEFVTTFNSDGVSTVELLTV